jgi:hypothetical protein
MDGFNLWLVKKPAISEGMERMASSGMEGGEIVVYCGSLKRR